MSSRYRFRIEEPHWSPAKSGRKDIEPSPGPQGCTCSGEGAQLRLELDAMRAAITCTKREVASLRAAPPAGGDVKRAASELDAVTLATEQAATTILGAVEEIETAANLLRASGVPGGLDDYLSVILERVLVLYEACNFQDLTGQRIRKVVRTLQFVEERLDRVDAIWGSLPVESAPADRRSGDAALVSGPGLPDDPGQVTQSDVDLYFS